MVQPMGFPCELVGAQHGGEDEEEIGRQCSRWVSLVSSSVLNVEGKMKRRQVDGAADGFSL